jgi:hypothetical protein
LEKKIPEWIGIVKREEFGRDTNDEVIGYGDEKSFFRVFIDKSCKFKNERGDEYEIEGEEHNITE